LTTRNNNLNDDSLLFPRESKPFGRSWEEWAASWCKWLLQLPKGINPSLDDTGENCCKKQEDVNVWFLAGSFGNVAPIKRYCKIPKHRSILFPILEKEDSFAEDVDLNYESELRLRAKQFMDRVKNLELIVDGTKVQRLYEYRVQSPIFDLNFPVNCVYDIEPGLTKAVCDGYWVFLRPLSVGEHVIQFSGEVAMIRNDTVTNQFKNDPLYAHLKENIDRNASFVLEIIYQIVVR